MNVCSLVRYLHTRARAESREREREKSEEMGVSNRRSAMERGWESRERGGAGGSADDDDDFPRVQSNNGGKKKNWVITCSLHCVD